MTPAPAAIPAACMGIKLAKQIAIIGGGPSGLIAAEIIASAGRAVTIYDRMPNLGRKFLMAGRGGLNLTHSEPLDKFLKRYREAENWLAPFIKSFTPDDLRAWCEALGEKTFVGSSGRVFPTSMKAAPLLRAWLRRLDKLGVKYMPRHDWQGWENSGLKFSTPTGQIFVQADATFLALGGASWPRLGSDGSWVNILSQHGVEISPLRPANCGFTIAWSDYFKTRFAGTPLKPVSISYDGVTQQGEIMITEQGIEGGAVYAISSSLREAITANGPIQIQLDLRPDMKLEALQKKMENRNSQSLSTLLKKSGFSPVAAALLHETNVHNSSDLASQLKSIRLTLTGTTNINKAISTAGGITRDSVMENLLLKKIPNVWVAGEMLDWEAPTGGYLLQACFSTGVMAAKDLLRNI